MNGEQFSVLDRYGENFTDKEYVTNPAIGRDEEIKQLLLVLLTPEKSAILIGKPGIGKTAIVEGLAYRIKQGDVPDALQGYTIINIKTASLLGTMPDGESKVQLLIDELKTKDKMILFIDEVHMLIGSTEESSLDFANIFKEGLGRGKIKVVGATTTEEYERYILRDKAFTRRFQRIEVPEPSRDETVKIMTGTLPKIEKETGARMKYSPYRQELIMGFLVDMTSEYKRVYEIGSRYPDCSLTLLKSAFSFAVFDNRNLVTILDFEKAIENTHLVYPDVIKKELPKFKVQFKEMYAEEEGSPEESTLELEEPKEDLILEEEFEEETPVRRAENITDKTTISAMGTRDTRVAPDPLKIDTSANLTAPVSHEAPATPKPDLELDNHEDKLPDEDDFPRAQGDNSLYISSQSPLTNMYQNQTSIAAMGTRDTRIVPQKEKTSHLDTSLLGDIDLNASPEKEKPDDFE